MMVCLLRTLKGAQDTNPGPHPYPLHISAIGFPVVNTALQVLGPGCCLVIRVSEGERRKEGEVRGQADGLHLSGSPRPEAQLV